MEQNDVVRMFSTECLTGIEMLIQLQIQLSIFHLETRWCLKEHEERDVIIPMEYYGLEKS